MKFLASVFLLFALLVQFGCSSKEAIKELVIYESLGDRFITYLTAEDFTAANKMLSDKMAKLLPSDKLKSAWLRSAKGLGKFISVKQVHISKATENYFIEFEYAIRPLSLSYSRSGKLDGVWFGPKYPISKRSKRIKSFDDFPLNVLIETPNKSPKKVVVFIHGSGPNDWNEGEGKLFKRISKSLNSSDIATVRYHKRTFEMQLLKYSNPSLLKNYKNKDFDNHFMSYFTKDAQAVVEYAKSIFPKSEVILFGHSQGTWIALQMANLSKEYKKLALLGSYNNQINETILEQSVYRHQATFRNYDKNNNGELTRWELRGDKNVLQQLPTLDLDKNKMISRSEWDAGNYTNYYRSYDSDVRSWLLQELGHPSPYEILSKGEFKALFLHGEWDNQTPAYFPRSIQLLNNTAWKKNYSFSFFKKLGHSLNRQKEYMDFNHKEIERKTLSEVTKELMAL